LLMRVSDPCSIQRQLKGDALTAMRAMSNLTPAAGRHSGDHTLDTVSKLRTSGRRDIGRSHATEDVGFPEAAATTGCQSRYIDTTGHRQPKSAKLAGRR
jgi:hypothetical protein